MGRRHASFAAATAPLLLSLALLAAGCEVDRRCVVYVGQDQKEAVAAMRRAHPAMKVLTVVSGYRGPGGPLVYCLMTTTGGNAMDGVVMICAADRVEELGLVRDVSDGVVLAEGRFRPAVAGAEAKGAFLRKGMEYEQCVKALAGERDIAALPDIESGGLQSTVVVPDGGTVVLGGLHSALEDYREHMELEKLVDVTHETTDRVWTRLFISREKAPPRKATRLLLLRVRLTQLDCRELHHWPPTAKGQPPEKPNEGLRILISPRIIIHREMEELRFPPPLSPEALRAVEASEAPPATRPASGPAETRPRQ